MVISPSVRGATNHLLKHDDDFAYVDGCDRSDEEPPGEDPPPGPPVDPPGGTGNPPHDPPSVAPGGPAAGSAGDLPFTGLPALAILLAGLAFVASGLLLVRRAGASG